MNSHGLRGWFGAIALAALSAWALAPASVSGQTFDAGVVPAVVRDASPKANEIQPVGCSSCGSGLFGGGSLTDGLGHGGCSSCGTGGCGRKDTCTPCGPEQCYAGKKPCDCCWEPHTHFGAVIKGVYNCICCNDPCYEPKWVPLANASFLLDSPRPITHMKLGADFGWDLRKPDKAELFWARANRRGPAGGVNVNNNLTGERSLDYTDAYMYNETAPTPGFGFFVYLPIRHVDPASYPSGSGFADMVVGTKSVILDCELLLATFMFKTYIPTGSANRGLGTGHVSLEPSLTAALKLTPHSYLQGQVGYRFPLGGDDDFQGSLLYAGLSYNHLLWNCGKDIQLIGTLEGYLACAQNGLFTDEFTGLPMSANQLGAFFNAGPGLRLVVCEKVDIGVGSAIQLTENGTMGDLVRVEFRWRF